MEVQFIFVALLIRTVNIQGWQLPSPTIDLNVYDLPVG